MADEEKWNWLATLERHAPQNRTLIWFSSIWFYLFKFYCYTVANCVRCASHYAKWNFQHYFFFPLFTHFLLLSPLNSYLIKSVCRIFGNSWHHKSQDGTWGLRKCSSSFIGLHTYVLSISWRKCALFLIWFVSNSLLLLAYKWLFIEIRVLELIYVRFFSTQSHSKRSKSSQNWEVLFRKFMR